MMLLRLNRPLKTIRIAAFRRLPLPCHGKSSLLKLRSSPGNTFHARRARGLHQSAAHILPRASSFVVADAGPYHADAGRIWTSLVRGPYQPFRHKKPASYIRIGRGAAEAASVRHPHHHPQALGIYSRAIAVKSQLDSTPRFMHRRAFFSACHP